jgi:hypothetical protein
MMSHHSEFEPEIRSEACNRILAGTRDPREIRALRYLFYERGDPQRDEAPLPVSSRRDLARIAADAQRAINRESSQIAAERGAIHGEQRALFADDEHDAAVGRRTRAGAVLTQSNDAVRREIRVHGDAPPTSDEIEALVPEFAGATARHLTLDEVRTQLRWLRRPRH